MSIFEKTGSIELDVTIQPVVLVVSNLSSQIWQNFTDSRWLFGR